MDREYVDERLTELTISHFEHVWKKTRGNRISDLLNELHTTLHKDIAHLSYSDTISNVKLFQGLNESFHQMLSLHLSQLYYEKGADIIRCNDVQGNLFIVFKGKLDIIIAKSRVCTLENGGCFGIRIIKIIFFLNILIIF